MKIVFIDYSEIYYGNPVKPAKPKKVIGKFVQMTHYNIEYLIFSPKELSKYHADLVRQFCRDRGIDGIYNDQIKRFDVHDPSWKILGGGKFEMDQEKGVLRLYDNSMAYGRFKASGMKKKILSLEALSGYKIEIE